MLAPTVGPGVPVTPLAHGCEVAQGVRPAGGTMMSMPRSPQHRVTTAPSYVVRATAHRAFALPSGTIVKGLPSGLRYSHNSNPPRCETR